MHLPRALIAVLFALAVGLPAQAVPSRADDAERARRAQEIEDGFVGLRIGELAYGVVLDGAHVLVYAGCYVVRAGDDSCAQVAADARATLE